MTNDQAQQAASLLIRFLETGTPPPGLFTESVFCDFTSPRWRMQAEGIRPVVELRRAGHPGPGKVSRSRCDPTPTGFVLEVEEEWTHAGESWYARELFRADMDGDAIAALSVYCLVAEPGTTLHALELAGSGDPADGGDAGPVLDARARAEYRARLSELISEREEAESFGDRGRSERAIEEMEALGAELERAFGLGGRERRVGAASERARTNVQRRITHALDQLRAASPGLGEHLSATIRTGTYCVYEARR